MPREIPDVPKGWKPPQPGSGRSYEIELITPLFGGGVSTRVNDPSFPIRPTSIRGQLQFWWRATAGAQYATRQELRAAQSAVWGDTTQASRVQVRVENVQATEPEPCARYETDAIAPARFARCRLGTRRSTTRPCLTRCSLFRDSWPTDGETDRDRAGMLHPQSYLSADRHLSQGHRLREAGRAGTLGVGRLRRPGRPGSSRLRGDRLQSPGTEGQR